MQSATLRVSFLVAILGHYPQVHRYAVRLLRELAVANLDSDQIEFLVLVHGEEWRRVLPLAQVASRGVKIVVVPCDEELPAAIFNKGAKIATGEFISFAWPGMDCAAWIASVRRLVDAAVDRPFTRFLAGHPATRNGPVDQLRSWAPTDTSAIPEGFQGGWLEMFDYIPMGCSAVSKDYFIQQGGFSCCPLLQRGFWWEFTIRVGRSAAIDLVDAQPQLGQWSWWDFPLNRDLPISGDIVARRAVRQTGAPAAAQVKADYSHIDSFMRDLPEMARQRLTRLLELWRPEGSGCSIRSESRPSGLGAQKNEPLRIVVLGGLNEPAHNQLCFYNYFALLEGQRVLTWRAILDFAAQYSDVEKADLVIFSRSRIERACRLMDYCVEQQIPTVYMLDDNWFSIAKEWPEYAALFTPGKPSYEHFMYCLSRANQVLTYNPILADDLRPYSRRLEVLPTNIDLTLFHRVEEPPRNRVRVGYAGSLRREESAFIALCDLVQSRDDIDVFLMCPQIPEPLKSLPLGRLTHQPYVFGYSRYARVLADARPDILLAPLSSTRTDASKCPNKYLETTAAGAAGIYSRTALYGAFIRHRDNGILVENNVAQWKSAISELVDDPELRRSILQAAKDDVENHFSTPAVLPKFLAFLTRAAAGETN